MRKPPSDQNPWRAAAMVGAIGVDIAFCTVAGYFIGRYAEGRLGGGEGWLIGGVLGGFFIGIATVVLLLKKFMEDNNE